MADEIKKNIQDFFSTFWKLTVGEFVNQLMKKCGPISQRTHDYQTFAIYSSTEISQNALQQRATGLNEMLFIRVKS